MRVTIIIVSFVVLLLISCTDERTGIEEPLAPSNLVLSQLNNETIQISWQDNSNNEDGFRIDRKIATGGWETEHIMLGEDATAWLDDSLTVFAEYKYRICAYHEDKLSEFVTATVPFLDLDSLAAPSNLTLEQPDAGSILLSWQDNSSAEEGFVLDRKIGDAGWEESYQIFAANTTSFTDTGLELIDTYYYRLRAFIGDDLSNEVQNSIYFHYEDISSISFNITGQVVITPYSPYEITVSLLDIYGEPVPRDFEVWFKLLACPQGTNINNLVYGTEDSLSVSSVAGQATATIFSGEHSGSVVVEVFVYNLQDQKISAIKSNIISYYSLPELIYITHGGIDSGINAGGGNWQLEVAAIITDSFGNPAEYGTAVWFSLEDPSNSFADPTWAVITGESYVGNLNANGNSVPGAAFTQLLYDGSYTNESLVIKVEVSGYAGIISESLQTSMPLQFGNIMMTPVPQQISWQNSSLPYTNNEDSLATTLHVVVTDGQNNPINGQEIIFQSSGGSLQPGFPGTNPSLGWTGMVNGQNGILDKIIYFYKYECPPPIPSPPGTSEYWITATISGTTKSKTINITLFRYVD